MSFKWQAKQNKRNNRNMAARKRNEQQTTPPQTWSGLFNNNISTVSTGASSSTGNNIAVDHDAGTYENPKFKEACAQMQQNIKKHLGEYSTQYLDSSESEDELDESSIIQKTIEKYNAGEGITNLRKTQELLQDALTSGAVVCLICIESIKRNDSVWSCNSCYCMLHIPCIQKWAKDSMFYYSTLSEGSSEKTENKWCCPKCRNEYKPSDVPSTYLCFCGKVEDPPPDPWILPHACGSTCEKDLKPFCGHRCILLCHPGPCPPCPTTVEKSCYCGKSRPASKRCSNKDWSCGKPCKKLLSCKQHYCEDPCHGDNCRPCEKRSEQYCLCGSEKKQRSCNEPEWRCEKVCGASLSCGNHTCQIQCHGSVCPPCPKSGARFCPCQKQTSVLPCTEEVATCGDTCEKLLECGLHQCTRRCHFGDCGECLQMRMMKCRCGLTKRNVRCCKEIFCDNKCKKKRDCQRHNCNKKCCLGNCPPCSAPCLRTLNCGKHKCQSRCHSGPCFPCRETAEIKCSCGETKTLIPCGLRRSAVPPRCLVNCKLPADCHHDERHQHRCHFGSCPPCRKICDKTLPCSHTCAVRCHSAVLTKIDVKKKKEGPWDVAYKLELVEKPCPPCNVPISISCLGKHVIHSFPCYEARPWSCGRRCGRKLLCSNHCCELECHDVANAPDTTQQGDTCEMCERPCEKARPQDCVHECRQLCHPTACKPCKERIKMRCHCQLNWLYIVCNEWTAASADKEELASCKNTCSKQLSCGHRCPRDCHGGPCPDRSVCKKKVTIRCSCNRIKREVPCISSNDNHSLDCTDECLKQVENLKLLEETRLRNLKQEEEKKRQLELEEFQRKLEGKKKKRKKPKETDQDIGRKFSNKILGLLVIVTSIIILTLFFYMLMLK